MTSEQTAQPRERWFAPHALLPTGYAADVSLEVADGRFAAVTPNSTRPTGSRLLPGLALPGLADTHSHAFHRALRGTTHVGDAAGSRREATCALAGRLDPENYYALARAVFAEKLLAGITTVGEFHYVHNDPDGRPYSYPNAMGAALLRAAEDAGLRMTLLDTLYLSGGLTKDGHVRLAQQEVRFTDGSLDDWARRVSRRPETERTRIGLGIHSVRAVPRNALLGIREVATSSRLARARGEQLVVHAHVSGQPDENAACQAYYGCTPMELLRDAGLVNRHFTAVHGTHLSASDVDLLGKAGASVAFCPTSRHDLREGLGSVRALLDAGARVSLGTDHHVVVDPFEEVRGLAMHERMAGRDLGPSELAAAVTAHASLGWSDVGALRPGHRADVVVVDTASPRTAGTEPAQVWWAATNADVVDVAVDGRFVVEDRRHVMGDVGAALGSAVAAVRG